MASNPLAQFPAFLQLPPEVRIIIWKEAILAGRIIKVDGPGCFQIWEETVQEGEYLTTRGAYSMEFRLNILPFPTPSIQGLLMASHEARHIALKSYPIYLPSLDPKKEIRLSATDALLFNDLASFTEELHKANDHDLELPLGFSHIHTLAHASSAHGNNPLSEALRAVKGMANHRGCLETLNLFLPGVETILLVCDEKQVVFSEGLENFVPGPFKMRVLTEEQNSILENAEQIKKEMEIVFREENWARTRGDEEPDAPEVRIVARGWKLACEPDEVVVEEEEYDGDNEDSDYDPYEQEIVDVEDGPSDQSSFDMNAEHSEALIRNIK